MSYTVGQAANMLGVAPSTLRYYESQGLLPALARTSGGQRVFSDTDLEACRMIECLKQSGLSLADVKTFMDMVAEGDATLADRCTLFEARRKSLEAEIEDMKRILSVLEYKCWYYNRAAEAGTEDAVRNVASSDVPAELRGAYDFLKVQA
jgi:DNA-binding transcriptional MerR regulator